MPPKGVSKAVSKKCPECKKQIPVATRICGCGHQFFEERRRSTSSLNQESTVIHTDADELHSIRPQRSPGEVSNTSSTSNSIQEVIHSVSISGTGSPMLPSTSKSNGATDGGKRRSERVKREKPNFYDALEYENQMRKARRDRQKDDPPPPPATTPSGRAKRERRGKNNSSHEEEEEEEPVVKEKKRRKKKKKMKKEEEEQEEEDVMAGISPYRERSFAYVLADINMKLGLNNPSFINIK